MSYKKIEAELKARRVIKDHHENSKSLEEQLQERLHTLRNMDLSEETLKDQGLNIMLEKMTEEERAEFDSEAETITESYSTILNAVCDALQDPKQRSAIMEEIKRRM